ncbi:hypothetical protein EJ06DRAFT_527373 [Trichodelitschia bisporula]|uniref:Uncharacterized protein n=1 Tax=Trichodelitschia bisporula TaxID=703511 RepID=A0A6G1I704_9PEZI|nr:hypothetical protein EJ06DRAFT_527373 [Trichodelitschia bisporula]
MTRYKGETEHWSAMFMFCYMEPLSCIGSCSGGFYYTETDFPTSDSDPYCCSGPKG